jgi:hypothetical protein
MNDTDMNTVIIEGTVTEAPVRLPTGSVRFNVETRIWHGLTREWDALTIPVKASKEWESICLETLHKGRRVRIIGRLAADDALTTMSCVLAERIEFKPQPFGQRAS